MVLTLLCESFSLMLLQSFRAIFALHRLVRTRLGERELHRFSEQLEILQRLYGGFSGLGIFKNDEGLALGFEIAFRDDVDDFTNDVEGAAEVANQVGEFDALVEVFDLD